MQPNTEARLTKQVLTVSLCSRVFMSAAGESRRCGNRVADGFDPERNQPVRRSIRDNAGNSRLRPTGPAIE